MKSGLAFEQGEKKVEQMRSQAGGVRQEQDRVATRPTQGKTYADVTAPLR